VKLQNVVDKVVIQNLDYSDYSVKKVNIIVANAEKYFAINAVQVKELIKNVQTVKDDKFLIKLHLWRELTPTLNLLLIRITLKR
jgi:hypothetical protein